MGWAVARTMLLAASNPAETSKEELRVSKNSKGDDEGWWQWGMTWNKQEQNWTNLLKMLDNFRDSLKSWMNMLHEQWKFSHLVKWHSLQKQRPQESEHWSAELFPAGWLNTCSTLWCHIYIYSNIYQSKVQIDFPNAANSWSQEF